jgi:16S rRNA A1518/A1519 N6-dimethyltransferase RsmA/KsgA/DIM1 with predicted DNA glycosylase/AP lyase activity
MLDDPRAPLQRADVIVGWGFAVKRCSMRPATMLTTSWAPWYELTITRRLSAQSFSPPPSTDAAVMTVTRRPRPLLGLEERPRFERFLRREFVADDRDAWEWARAFRGHVVTPRRAAGPRRGEEREGPRGRVGRAPKRSTEG